MTRERKSFFATVFLVAFFLLASLSLPAGDTSAALTILQTADIHGSPRIARIVSIVEQERAEAFRRGESILWIDCGDLTSGAFEALLDEGDAIVEALNLAGCDAWIPGNHDFDLGSGVLRRHLNSFRGAILGANLKLDPPPENPILPWRVFRRNGLRVAVIGCTSPYLRHWLDPVRLAGVSVFPLETALDQVMGNVRKERPDLILLAVHAGEYSAGRLNPDGKVFSLATLVRTYPEIVLVLAGHSHQTVPGKFLYPDSWLVQAPAHGGGVAKIRIHFDRKTRRVIGIDSEILNTDLYPDSPRALALLKKNLEHAHAESHRIVACLPENWTPGAAALLTARAMAASAGAELAFAAAPDPDLHLGGPLSARGLFLLVPFEDFITTLDLTPSQVCAILNEQSRLEGSRPPLAVSGVELCPGPEGKPGTETLLLRPSGKVWKDEHEKHRAAFSSYDVSGAGGRFPVLSRIARSGQVNRRDTDRKMRTALEFFLREKFPPQKQMKTPIRKIRR